jgi:hypothetical protein
MNMILAAAVQLGLPCLEAPVTPAQFQSMKAHVRSDALMLESQDMTGTMQPAATAATDTYADREDLLFYFASHVQVVGDLARAPSNPWLELRSLADLRLRHFSESRQGGAATARVGNKACGWSAAGDFAFAATLPAFAQGDAATPGQAGRDQE